MTPRSIPELLAPAGSLEAVRAAVANGANAVYLGAERYNARDEGAQLTLDEVEQACAIAHERGVRIYLTLNILLKDHELADALRHLGDAVDRGIDAVIVQDLGLVRLIRRVFPDVEIHGSTQMTVHDVSAARLMESLGVERVVLARENTLDDIRSIRASVGSLGLEAFVHGALCISYSGQCLMSGMISERSANRGSCAQSCRKDYVLTDAVTGAELDRGYLISARDLAAHDQLAQLADAGIACLKIEGRKKRPEYVATVTSGYRRWLERTGRGDDAELEFEEVRPLVQIYSRGFTAGMLVGRSGRPYVTREQPDNRGHEIGVVTGYGDGELFVDVSHPVDARDGLGFEPPPGVRAPSTGFAVQQIRTIGTRGGMTHQAIRTRERVPVGWRVMRSSQGELLERARASYAAVPDRAGHRKTPLSVRLFGHAGAPLKAIWHVHGEEVETRSEAPLVMADRHPLSDERLREQLGRLGETPFVLTTLDRQGLTAGVFLPVSELNHLRTSAVSELLARRDWARVARDAERQASITEAIEQLPPSSGAATVAPRLIAQVYNVADALAAAGAGATEIVFDPFLRHPVPPVARVTALATTLANDGKQLRLRLPTIVRPEERPRLDRWLATELPLLVGHVGLAVELAAHGRDVTADYAVNCFNRHTAQLLLERGIRRIVASVELTTAELATLVSPWGGAPFEVVVYGRPEGMTIEHCVLSAAFERVATTCRDLCVQKHQEVTLTDPSGYTFPVTTDSACRNRLLHSRPIEGSEFAPGLLRAGIRGFILLFNVPGEPVAELTAAWRRTLGAFEAAASDQGPTPRDLVGREFTRGHFVRAV